MLKITREPARIKSVLIGKKGDVQIDIFPSSGGRHAFEIVTMAPKEGFGRASEEGISRSELCSLADALIEMATGESEDIHFALSEQSGLSEEDNKEMRFVEALVEAKGILEDNMRLVSYASEWSEKMRQRSQKYLTSIAKVVNSIKLVIGGASM